MKIDAGTLASLRGHDCIYVARSEDDCWIKIGFSSHLTQRLNALDSAFPDYAPFIPVGACRSSYRAEQQIHRALRSLHVEDCREIYPAFPQITRLADSLVAWDYLPHFEIDDYFVLKAWAKRLSAHIGSLA